MTKTVRAWVFSAIAILLVVIIGYYIIQGSNEPEIHPHGFGSVIEENENAM